MDESREDLLAALQEAERKYRNIFEDGLLGIALTTPEGRLLEVNKAFAALTGYKSPQQMIDEVTNVGEEVYADQASRERIKEILARDGMVSGFETRFKRRDGGIIWVLINSRVVMDAGGKVLYFDSMLEDITARKLAEEEMQGKMRELNALYLASQAFLGLTDIELLHEEICRLIVDQFGLRMAWIGILEEGSYEVRPVSIYGEEADYLKNIRVTWDDTPSGQGPTGKAIRCGQAQAVDRIDEDPEYTVWHERAMALGYRSSASLPMRYEDRIIGALSLYSDLPGYFTEDRLRVLQSYANLAAVAMRRAALHAEVKSYAGELERRVAERTAELEAANHELEAFSYSVSHDLRAPLRAMDGFSKMLMEDYHDSLDETGRDYLARVHGASQRMAQLIDDLLSLSRVTRAEMRREPVDLSALALEAVEAIRRKEPERRVEVAIAPGLEVWGDPRLLGLVLENLLSNAWKFTSRSDEARIELGALEEAEGLVYFVKDNGAGFEMAYVDKLFNAFQRLHSASEYPGTGVGLATVQRIVRRHGGQVRAEGETGKGATFYFTLPPSLRNCDP